MTHIKQESWIDDFNRLYVARDGRWFDDGCTPLVIKDFIAATRQAAAEEERNCIFKQVTDMEEEDNYTTAYADYTENKAIANSKAILNYNHALSDVKKFLRSRQPKQS